MARKQAGKNIRTLRERKAWTQEHLADAARISVRTVQRAEDGALSAETMASIAGALKGLSGILTQSAMVFVDNVDAHYETGRLRH